MRVSFRRARRACFVAMVFTALASAALTWSGFALFAVGMTDAAVASFVAAAVGILMSASISPRAVYEKKFFKDYRS